MIMLERMPEDTTLTFFYFKNSFQCSIARCNSYPGEVPVQQSRLPARAAC